jgi:ferritin-like metal-binding protein YciE
VMPETTMAQPQDLLVYELSRMYVFEQHNVDTLTALAEEVDAAAARRPLEHHLKETREQLVLLEECFDLLEVRPQKVTVNAATGMRHDHEAFVKLHPAPALLTLYDLHAAAQVEHLEVAAYRGLIDAAAAAGLSEVVTRLRRILKQEEDSAAELEAAAKTLGAKATPAPA